MSTREFRTVSEYSATTFNGFGMLLVGLVFCGFGT